MKEEIRDTLVDVVVTGLHHLGQERYGFHRRTTLFIVGEKRLQGLAAFDESWIDGLAA